MNDLLFVRGFEHSEQSIQDIQHGADIQRAAPTPHELLERFALEQLHHQVDQAVLGHVVIEDADRTRVPNAVGQVAFPQESLTQFWVVRELRQQHLDRDTVTVSVGRGEHGGHAPDPDELVELPLMMEDRAYA